MGLFYSLSIIFTILAIGFGCGNRRMLNETQIEGFEIFLFKIALPCYLFTSMLDNDLHSLINLPFISSYLLAFAVISSIVAGYFWNKDTGAKICIKILASGYINATIYTLPVITFLLGNPDSAILGNLIQVFVIQSLCLIILTTISHKEQSILLKLFKIFTNPLVIMPILGIVLHPYQSQLGFFTKITHDLGCGAAGMALFTFGLNLSHTQIKRENINPELMFLIGAKNLIHPIVALLIGRYLFNLDRYWLSSLVISASAPTAFVVYLIAKQFAVEVKLVKNMVAISSVFSLLSLILLILFFN